MCWHRPEAAPRSLRARPVRRNSHRPSKFLKIVASAAKQPPTRRSFGDACSACLRADGSAGWLPGGNRDGGVRVWRLPDPGAQVKLRAPALRQLGAAIAVSALVAACTPDVVPPPSSPTPTPSPTSASPTENALEREQRLAFEGAERAYRQFRKEYTRISTSGGADKPTAAMRATADGPYLKVMTQFLAKRKATKTRSTTGLRIGYVNPGTFSPEELTLSVCEDGSNNRILDRNGKQVGKGIAQELTLYVRPIDGRWKIWDGDNKTVKSCG